LLQNWRARHQFRWNKDSNEMSVKQILAFVLGRVGLKLETQFRVSRLSPGFIPILRFTPMIEAT
jgi:hypothetical protein